MNDETVPVEKIEHITPINQPEWDVMPDQDWDDGTWDEKVSWV